ncbi:MAG TPA: hypothetical protein VES38_08880 [Methylotenera sp.]|nr:hypothetical protein [Methylotenera sp.]
MMTREDMLRELELLPVWTLRTPQSQVPETESVLVQTVSVVTESIISTEAVLQVELKQVDISLISDESLQPLVAESESFESIEQVSDRQVFDTAEPIIKEFNHIASEDGDWLFVLPDELQSDEAILFSNILVAMRIKAKPTNTLAVTNDVLATTQPKIIITMGETTVQQLLQSTESLTSLRGKLHKLQGIPLVSTYDLAHLLKTSSDKSKVWDDLCLAMEALHDLKSRA